MKKLLLALFSIGSLATIAQAPQLINYQGVARNATGTALSNTPLTLTVNILNPGVAYSETHNVTSNNVGIFTLKIGGGSVLSGSFPTINWGTTTNSVEIIMNPGTGAVSFPPQQLVSVPYALYAETSGSGSASLTISQNTIGVSGGNSITIPTYSAGTGVSIAGPGAGNTYTINSLGSVPPGTVTGQTLFWNGTAWQPNVNLFNDGNRAGVGISTGLQAKLHVSQPLFTDTSALYVSLLSGQARSSAVRAFAAGSSSIGNYAGAISGGHFLGANTGSGVGVGVIGQGFNSSATGVAVGIYATATGPSPFKWAGIFDGQVQISDSVFLTNTPNTGNAGDVMTRSSTGRLVWKPLAATSSAWVSSAGSTTLTNANDNVSIGTTSSSAKLNVGTSVGFGGNDVQISSAGSVDALQIFKFAGNSAIHVINSNGSATAPLIDIGSAVGNPVGININLGGNSAALSALASGSQAAITATNNGGAPSIKGSKPITSGGGNVIYAENLWNGNTADAVFVTTNGKGAGIHAVLGPTVTGSSNVALWAEEGHIRSTGTAPASVVASVGGGISLTSIQVSIAPVGACTDVSGSYQLTFPPTAWNGGNYIDVTLTFNKPFVGSPRPVATVVGQPLICFVISSSSTNVTYRLISPAGTIGPFTNVSFNYFNIEN